MLVLPRTLTRRQFLAGTAALAAGPYIIPQRAWGANARVNVGCIGLGPQGNGLLSNFLNQPLARVVAVCDVNAKRRDEARDRINQRYGDAACAAYTDFRELVARKDIDAVCVASPDHWHVLHALAAVRSGKDVYVEKPMAISLAERQALRTAVQAYGRLFQFGTQQRSDRNFRFACELVRNGRIGQLRTIQVGSPASHGSGNFPEEPVPDWLDYDLWLGQAPWAPYSSQRIVNDTWWHCTDYAMGFIAGWGIHHIDIAQWGNGTELSGPVSLEGIGSFPREGMCDCATKWWVHAVYANGVRLEYADEGQIAHGIRFEGDEGWVYVRRGFINAGPDRLLREVIRPDEAHLYESPNHVGNFVECVLSRKPTICPIDQSVASDTICQISDIAIRLERRLTWDPVAEQFVNDDEANRRLNRAMRSPWRL